MLFAVLLVIVAEAGSVTFPKGGSFSGPSGAPRSLFAQELLREGEEELGVCLRSDDPLLSCLASGAARSLQSARSSPELELGDGLKLVQDYDMAFITDDPPIGDPREARTILDSLGLYMKQRYLQWDLDFIYPGLLMRVGPAAKGTLHFLMDQRRAVDDRSLSTGRLLMKRTVLPVLLGFKMNVVSLVPLLVGALIFLIKKALILSKLSLLVSGLAFFRPRGPFGTSSSAFGGSHSGSVFGGSSSGGLGSFADPPKHVIIDRPVDWFREENDVPLTI